MFVHCLWRKVQAISLVHSKVLSVWGFTLDGHPLDEIVMSSPTPAKIQDEAIVVVDKFGVTLGGDQMLSGGLNRFIQEERSCEGASMEH